MKTNKFYTVLTILLVIMFAIAINTSANNLWHFDNPPEIEQTNINLMDCCGEMIYNFEEESYISDIPFNTTLVSANLAYEEALSENYENVDELYIEDIPFDTEKISAESISKTTIETEYELTDEAYVEDIPFDTYSITQVYFQSHYTLSE